MLQPTSYIITVADLHQVYEGNRIFKFANDTYLVVPGKNAHMCPVEIDHLQTWAAANRGGVREARARQVKWPDWKASALAADLASALAVIFFF